MSPKVTHPGEQTRWCAERVPGPKNCAVDSPGDTGESSICQKHTFVDHPGQLICAIDEPPSFFVELTQLSNGGRCGPIKENISASPLFFLPLAAQQQIAKEGGTLRSS